MTWTPVALSLTHSFTEVGALVALAGLLGIAVLSLLLFSQGREIKRLREWAGRAPERAAELEQRMAGQPQAAAPQPREAVPGRGPDNRVASVRPVPRSTPLVTHATVAAGQGVPAAGAPATVSPAKPGEPAAVPAGQSNNSSPGTRPANAPTPVLAPAASAAASVAAASAAGQAAMTASAASVAPDASAPAAAQQDPAAVGAPSGAPPPATAAGAAAPRPAPRAPASVLPPSPQPAPALPVTPQHAPSDPSAPAPIPPSVSSPQPVVAQAAGVAAAQPAAVAAPAADGPPRPETVSSLPAPDTTAAAGRPSGDQRLGSPTVGALAENQRPAALAAESAGAIARPRYPPSPGRSRSADAQPVDAMLDERLVTEPPGGSSERRLPDPSEFRYLRDEPRQRGTRRGLIAGVGLLAVLAAILIVVATSGGGSSPSTSTSARHVSHGHAGRASSAPGGAETSAPAQLHVAVLNSTEVSGLAHRVASTLQEHGFRKAQALAGRPPGGYASSVIEYAPGYASSAQEVARALGIEAANVRPLESGTAPMAPGASVVVVAANAETSGAGTG